jgi:hypothetical protein
MVLSKAETAGGTCLDRQIATPKSARKTVLDAKTKDR